MLWPPCELSMTFQRMAGLSGGRVLLVRMVSYWRLTPSQPGWLPLGQMSGEEDCLKCSLTTPLCLSFSSSVILSLPNTWLPILKWRWVEDNTTGLLNANTTSPPPSTPQKLELTKKYISMLPPHSPYLHSKIIYMNLNKLSQQSTYVSVNYLIQWNAWNYSLLAP